MLTHHLRNTQTLENQKGKVLYYVYITKYHKLIQNTEIFFQDSKAGSNINFQNLWKFLERQCIQSKACLPKRRSTKQKTKGLKR